MNRNGMFQWNQSYPSLDVIENDIQNKTLFTLTDNWVIKGIIVLNESQPPEYKQIDWEYTNTSDPVMIIHRLAVHPLFQNQGVGRKMMDFAIEYAGKKNYPLIRLDVFEGNLSANKLYSKLGFSEAGKFRFPFQETEFVCYEIKI